MLHLRFRIAVAVALGGAGFLAGVTAAAAPCEVRLAGPASDAWTQAVHEMASRLDDHPAGDCASIVVATNGNSARLVYTTRDGRTAERTLAAPAELRPTVEALLAGGRIEQRPAESGRPPPPHETNPPEIRTQPPVVVSPAPARAPASRPIFSIGAGARVGDHTLVTPLGELGGSLDVGAWELGVKVDWESGYHALDDHPEARRASGFAAGVALGRRDALGSGIALLYGTDVMLASLDDDRSERLQQGHVGHAEARLGGYIGAVVPRNSSPRFRATLGADVLPTQIGQPEKDPSGDALTPWIAATLVLGMEIGTP